MRISHGTALTTLVAAGAAATGVAVGAGGATYAKHGVEGGSGGIMLATAGGLSMAALGIYNLGKLPGTPARLAVGIAALAGVGLGASLVRNG